MSVAVHCAELDSLAGRVDDALALGNELLTVLVLVGRLLQSLAQYFSMNKPTRSIISLTKIKPIGVSNFLLYTVSVPVWRDFLQIAKMSLKIEVMWTKTVGDMDKSGW